MMVRDTGSRHTLGRRLISLFGAAAGGLLAVIAILFLISRWLDSSGREFEPTVLVVLPLVFAAAAYAVYRQLQSRDSYLLLTLLYTAPVLAFVAAIFLDTADVADYPTAAQSETAREEATRPSVADPPAAVPRFPWPPPRASGIEVLPTVFLRNQITLGDVAIALDRALTWIGRHEIRFYSVPNGFAMVTRLEAIDEQGDTIADADRDQRDFLTYIRNLFWVPPGNYRMIVFVVTDEPFASSGEPMDRKRADELASGGFNDLPQVERERLYTDRYRTTALIYEFHKERQSEVAQVLTPGRFPAHYHLDRIGWFAAAQDMPQMADLAVLFPSPTAAGLSGPRPR